ncbi:MAG: CoA pyrophosphatase [Calditrichota bacterium]
MSNMENSKYLHIDFNEAINIVRQKLHAYKPVILPSTTITRAAVLILFLNKKEIPHILFTKRTESVETHKGQISFPGGAWDKTDKSLKETAVRETLEEVGIPPKHIRHLGRLDDFFTVTDFIVSPFAAFTTEPADYLINEAEVAEVLEVPLSLFLQKSHFEVKKWEHRGQYYDVYFYYYGNQVIWGATAFMLNRFIDTVFDYNPAPHPVRQDPRNLAYLRENRVRGGSKS